MRHTPLITIKTNYEMNNFTEKWKTRCLPFEPVEELNPSLSEFDLIVVPSIFLKADMLYTMTCASIFSASTLISL